MSKDALELLFNSRARVKILKFLFRNMGPDFGVKDISNRIQEEPSTVRREIKKLLKIGLLKQKNSMRIALARPRPREMRMRTRE